MTESVESYAMSSLDLMHQSSFQVLVCSEMKLLERLQARMDIGPHENFTERKRQSRQSVFCPGGARPHGFSRVGCFLTGEVPLYFLWARYPCIPLPKVASLSHHCRAKRKHHNKVLRTSTCKPRPESGLDCLICAIFSRHRSS
jgi:hypothetical protein